MLIRGKRYSEGRYKVLYIHSLPGRMGWDVLAITWNRKKPNWSLSLKHLFHTEGPQHLSSVFSFPRLSKLNFWTCLRGTCFQTLVLPLWTLQFVCVSLRTIMLKANIALLQSRGDYCSVLTYSTSANITASFCSLAFSLWLFRTSRIFSAALLCTVFCFSVHFPEGQSTEHY